MPTLESAALRVVITGDDNQNAGGTVLFRAAGETAWRNGHRLVRVLPDRMSSLLFNLSEGTTYEVQVRFTDPDGAPSAQTVRFTTRTTPRSVAVRTLHVGPTGSGAQYTSIGTALKASVPGDTILVHPGVYREGILNISKSGTPDAPITIKAAGPGVYMRGDDPRFSEPHTTPMWTRQADGTWATTPLPLYTMYVAVNGKRLYHCKTQTSLQTARSSGKSGWWQDSTKRLFVTLPGGVSPDTFAMQIAQKEEAFRFQDVHDIILDGLDIGYYGTGYGKGLYILNSHDITVRNCNIHNTTYGVQIKGGSNNIVEGCHITDDGLDGWTWGSIKGTDAEGVGVCISFAGTGNVVRRNQISGVFNGVASLGSEESSAGTDVYYNWIHDLGDDGIEPEGGGRDFRAWCNTVRNVQNGVSLAPINTGPTWVLFNTISEFRESGLKVSAASSGAVLAYHNTMVTTLPGVNALSPWSGMRNFTLRNNIIAGTRYIIEDYHTGADDHASFDSDLLYTSDASRFVKLNGVLYGSLAKLQAAGIERHGRAGNPQFMGGDYGDYRLLPTSPARHGAVPIPGINDFLGTAPDIGALQMGS